MPLSAGAIGITQYCVLILGVFTVLASLALSVAWPTVRRRLAGVEPSRRATLLMMVAAAPLAVGVFTTLLGLAPGVIGFLWPAMDHCATHPRGPEPHLCLAHTPAGPGTVLGWAMAAVWLALVAGPVARHVRRARRSRELLQQLLRTSRPSSDQAGVVVLETDQPIAAVTAVSDDVLVSRGLLGGLAPELLGVVLEHEREHVRRRDPMRQLVAGLLTTVLLPPTRKALLAELQLACEQACDEVAAVAVGDRLTVARALLAVERLVSGGSRPCELGIAAARFCRHALARRVESMLGPTPAPSRPVAWKRWALALVVFSAIAAHPVHHAADVVLGLLAG